MRWRCSQTVGVAFVSSLTNEPSLLHAFVLPRCWGSPAQPSIATNAASGLSSWRRMSHVWHLPDAGQADHLADLARELGITSSIAGLLMRLGLADIETARRFLFPKLRELSNPFWLRGMEKTVDRILLAIDRRERIVLYGDYDV